MSNRAPIAIVLLTSSLFTAGGLVVVTLRTSALAYPDDQRSMAAGIASWSFSAAVAITLPICGHFFDRQLCTEAFRLVALLPIIGTTIWWLFPVRPAGKDLFSTKLGTSAGSTITARPDEARFQRVAEEPRTVGAGAGRRCPQDNVEKTCIEICLAERR